MSAFVSPTRPNEKDRKTMVEEVDDDDEEDDETSAAESEEFDQLLLSYRKNPLPPPPPTTTATMAPSSKKRSSEQQHHRRLELDSSATSTNGGETIVDHHRVIAVSIENDHSAAAAIVDRSRIATDIGGGVENIGAVISPSDVWLLQNEESSGGGGGGSSASLLRDLLPHMSESNTAAIPSPMMTAATIGSSAIFGSSTIPPSSSMSMSKTYTEPTSLSGLLRQVGNRLFSHYPSRVARRHSKISPTTSIHCKLSDDDDEENRGDVIVGDDEMEDEEEMGTCSSRTTVLTSTMIGRDEVEMEVDDKKKTAAIESVENEIVAKGSSSTNPDTSALVRRFFEQQQQQQQKRYRRTPLCRRCPHCRKSTSLLRKISIPDDSMIAAAAASSSCSCRICMILESVESSLSSPATSSTSGDAASSRLMMIDDRGASSNLLPTSSTTTIDLSSFSNEDCGDSREGLIAAASTVEPSRHVSLGGMSSLELGLFCHECNSSNRGGVGGGGETSCGGGGGTHSSEKLESAAAVIGNSTSINNNNNNNTTAITSSICNQLKSREQGIQVNSSSMISIATSSSFGGPVCRICHSPGDKLEPLISPCRCLGTLKYVHASCLLHWLDISSRKLRRPPHCELCGYRYQRHKTMKLRRIQWPTCSRRDKLYHVLFMVSVMMMIACAAVTIVCFKSDHRTAGPPIKVEKSVAQPNHQPSPTGTGGGGGASGSGGGNGASPTNGTNPHGAELTGQEVITLVCGILFFCAFFVAMYVQVKAQTTVYKLCVRFWTMNQEWRVDEYRREKDAEYWRQRQEQQMLQQQQQLQKRAAVCCQSSSNSAPSQPPMPQMPPVITAIESMGNADTPLIRRVSLSLSHSSTMSSFHGDDILNGID